MVGRIHQVLYNFVQKIQAKEIVPNLLCVASIILVPKPEKGIVKKEITEECLS